MGMFCLANQIKASAIPITTDQSVAEIPQSLTAADQSKHINSTKTKLEQNDRLVLWVQLRPWLLSTKFQAAWETIIQMEILIII